MRIGRMREKGRLGERGAALVEMAIVTPFLLLVLFGTVEFAYKFAQYNEIRHASREGARYASVSNEALDLDGDGVITATDVVMATCDAMSLPAAGASITTTMTGAEIGDMATLQISVAVSSLSNVPLVTGLLPSSLSDTATFRLEQPATWSAFTNQPCP